MSGTVGILNVGAGDIELSFNPENPTERIRAARIRFIAPPMGHRSKMARDSILSLRFGRIVIVEYIPGRAGLHPKALCRCDCGSHEMVFIDNLRRGVTRSCGCLNDQIRVSVNTRHGMTGTREYTSWRSMLQRCYDQKSDAYANYGGRGIQVCDSWRQSFERFFAFMGERPSRHSLDRWPNQNGNYEPGNCRWANRTQQSQNRRSNRLLTHGGETKTVAEWASITGLPYSTLFARIHRRGWDTEMALTVPRRKGNYE